jgi:hypothetical protein
LDAFITRINPQGSGLLFPTFLGAQGEDEAAGVAVDRSAQTSSICLAEYKKPSWSAQSRTRLSGRLKRPRFLAGSIPDPYQHSIAVYDFRNAVGIRIQNRDTESIGGTNGPTLFAYAPWCAIRPRNLQVRIHPNVRLDFPVRTQSPQITTPYM